VIRALQLFGIFLLGLLIGVVGAFVQADRFIMTVPWGLLVVPWGMVLVILVLVIVIRGATWYIESRWGGSVLLAGWIAATIVMSAESPSGDVALSGGGRQWVYLLGGVILGAAAATFPVIHDRVAPRFEPINA
jgi:hypothetical protein